MRRESHLPAMICLNDRLRDFARESRVDYARFVATGELAALQKYGVRGRAAARRGISHHKALPYGRASHCGVLRLHLAMRNEYGEASGSTASRDTAWR